MAGPTAVSQALTPARQGWAMLGWMRLSLLAPAGCGCGGTGDCARLPLACPGEGGREVRGIATPGCAERTRAVSAPRQQAQKLHPPTTAAHSMTSDGLMKLLWSLDAR